ncbi:hypothetical protein ACJX0J_035577, partial [Zea mays]
KKLYIGSAAVTFKNSTFKNEHNSEKHGVSIQLRKNRKKEKKKEGRGKKDIPPSLIIVIFILVCSSSPQLWSNNKAVCFILVYLSPFMNQYPISDLLSTLEKASGQAEQKR